MVEKLEMLKRLKTKLINRRITLNAMNRVLQPQRSSDRNMYFSKFLSWEDESENGSENDTKQHHGKSDQRKHEQLHAILQQDLDQVMEEQNRLQEQYDDIMKRTVEVNSQLNKSRRVMQEMHGQMEALYVHNHSIDNLHTRFGLSSSDKSLMMNIGCTHMELLHGTLHIFENWVCFESIVLLNDDKGDNRTNTIVIPASNIQTISKQGIDGIVIKCENGSRTEFFHFKENQLDSVFETLFQIKAKRK